MGCNCVSVRVLSVQSNSSNIVLATQSKQHSSSLVALTTTRAAVASFPPAGCRTLFCEMSSSAVVHATPTVNATSTSTPIKQDVVKLEGETAQRSASSTPSKRDAWMAKFKSTISRPTANAVGAGASPNKLAGGAAAVQHPNVSQQTPAQQAPPSPSPQQHYQQQQQQQQTLQPHQPHPQWHNAGAVLQSFANQPSMLNVPSNIPMSNPQQHFPFNLSNFMASQFSPSASQYSAQPTESGHHDQTSHHNDERKQNLLIDDHGGGGDAHDDGDDDDSTSEKRQRNAKSKAQRDALWLLFGRTDHPSRPEREQFVREHSTDKKPLTVKDVERWFRNTRFKEKQKREGNTPASDHRRGTKRKAAGALSEADHGSDQTSDDDGEYVNDDKASNKRHVNMSGSTHARRSAVTARVSGSSKRTSGVTGTSTGADATGNSAASAARVMRQQQEKFFESFLVDLMHSMPADDDALKRIAKSAASKRTAMKEGHISANPGKIPMEFARMLQYASYVLIQQQQQGQLSQLGQLGQPGQPDQPGCVGFTNGVLPGLPTFPTTTFPYPMMPLHFTPQPIMAPASNPSVQPIDQPQHMQPSSGTGADATASSPMQ